MTSEPTTIASAILVLLLNIVVLGLVPERRRSGSAMAWLRLILVVTVFELLFLLTGDTHVLRTRREEQRMAGELIRSSLGAIPALPPSSDRLGCLASALV